MPPSYIVIGCKSNKKIAFICYKSMKIVFYNIKKSALSK